MSGYTTKADPLVYQRRMQEIRKITSNEAQPTVQQKPKPFSMDWRLRRHPGGAGDMKCSPKRGAKGPATMNKQVQMLIAEHTSNRSQKSSKSVSYKGPPADRSAFRPRLMDAGNKIASSIDMSANDIASQGNDCASASAWSQSRPKPLNNNLSAAPTQEATKIGGQTYQRGSQASPKPFAQKKTIDDLNNLLGQMGGNRDPRCLTMNNQHLPTPKYNYVPVKEHAPADVFMFTQPPFMSPKVKDQDFQHNGDPVYKVNSGDEAHFVFKSPIERQRRVLTIAQRVTARPEDDEALAKHAPAVTRKAALQILLGGAGNSKSRHIDIKPINKTQKHAQTNQEISKLRNDRNNALKDIDNHINNNFGPNSDIAKGNEQQNISTIHPSQTQHSLITDDQASTIDPGSPRKKRQKVDQSIESPESSPTLKQRSMQVPIMQVQPMYAKDTKQGRYYLDIEDEFSQHLLSGAVNNQELDEIRENNSHKEPQIALIRDQLHKMMKTGKLEEDIPFTVMKARGKGQHDFTVENYERDVMLVEKEEMEIKYAVEDKNIYKCEAQEEEALLFAQKKEIPEDMIDPLTARMHHMLVSKRVQLDTQGKKFLDSVIKKSYLEKDSGSVLDEAELEDKMPPIESSEMDNKIGATGIVGSMLHLQTKHKVEDNRKVENRAMDQYSVVTETLFSQQALKQEFFKNAKERAPGNKAMEIFFQECNRNRIIPMPLFSKLKETGILSMSSQFISEGMATAYGLLLADKQIRTQITLTEVNLDDNGLKDHSFAAILEALQFHMSIKKFNYSNNELGEKSLPLISNIIQRSRENHITELRISGIKSTPVIQRDLFKAIKKAPQIMKLRLSNLKNINDKMFKKLVGICKNESQQLVDLNLSSMGLLAQQLDTLMETIMTNMDGLQSLNFANNAIIEGPADGTGGNNSQKYSTKFVDKIVAFIKKSTELQHLDLSNMNLRDRVQLLQWPIYHSQSLQAVHLSNNELSDYVIMNMLFVMGIKSDADVLEQIKGGGSENNIIHQKTAVMQQKNAMGKMALTHAEAASMIANSEQAKQIKDQRFQAMSTTKAGVGRHISAGSPLVLTRKLAHPELFYDESKGKQLHFDKNAGLRWQLSLKENCWICQKWKYATIFYQHDWAKQNFTRISDLKIVNRIKELYQIGQGEDVILTENPGLPMIMGSVTGFKCTRMSPIDTYTSQLAGKGAAIKEHGTEEKAEKHRTLLMMMGNGIRKQINYPPMPKPKQVQGWRYTFEEYLPYKPKDMLIFNMPPQDEETPPHTPFQLEKFRDREIKSPASGISEQMSERMRNGLRLQQQKSSLSKVIASRMKDWMQQYKDVTFCYAGYLKPGKHQMIIYDELNDAMWFKDILADSRQVPIKQNDGGVNQNVSHISKFINESGAELIDRDNSVFMNFQQFSEKNLVQCYANDRLFSRVFKLFDEEELENEDCEYEQLMEQLNEEYELYCEFFHCVSAEVGTFPFVKVKELPELFHHIGLTESVEQFAEIAKSDSFIDEIKKCRKEHLNQEFPLNRTYFFEQLILVIKVLLVDSKKYDNLTDALNFVMMNTIEQFIQRPPEKVHKTLTQFRRKFVWNQTVNSILHQNLEGIMGLYEHFQEKSGLTRKFTAQCAKKVLHSVHAVPEVMRLSVDSITHDKVKQLVNQTEVCDCDTHCTRIQGVQVLNKEMRSSFDLAQMIVLNENGASNEYLDMELMEFLEFIVRISYVAATHSNEMGSKHIGHKVRWVLQPMLEASGKEYKVIDIDASIAAEQAEAKLQEETDEPTK